MTKQVVRYLVILFLALLLAAPLVLPFPVASGQSSPDAEQLSLPPNPEEPPTKAYPNLDSALAQLVVDGKAQGTSHARALAEEMGFTIQDEASVRVIIESEAVATNETIAAAEALGAVVETTYQNLIQARVPLAALEALSQTPGVKFVERPITPVPLTVVSEGVNVIGANTWQTAGFRGAGVKVAVVDGGFSGYSPLLGTELPANVITHWSPSLGGPGSSPHGTACAEVVYDVAPDATLYLVNMSTSVELANAVDWLITQGVTVISHSIGWYNAGLGDGTGFLDSIVDNARAHGILWVNAAGNNATDHWSGTWSDSDNDNWHNFSGNVEANEFPAYAGDVIRAYLRWNDTWGASSNDFDLYLYKSGVPSTVVAQSTNPQDGSRYPVESITYPVTTSGYYFLSLRRSAAVNSVVFDLFVPHFDILYQTAAGSIVNPAESPNALAVGAVDWQASSTIEYSSSQGPTRDGRVKPDIVAPNYVSTFTYGPDGFGGTSAAAPHVAGAAALVKQRYPSFTPTQIQSFLEGRAVGLGASGKDNVFGSGRLQLGSPYDAPVANFHASATTVQAGTPVTFTDDSTNFPTSWAWDFDNNGSTDSFLQNPSHTYTLAGTYSVKLTATSSAGSGNATKTNYVMVTAGPLHHITVTPSNPSVTVSGTQTYAATGYDQYNNLRTGDVFTWSVTNPTAGSINASTGVFTAGTVAGNYTDVIRASSGAVNATTSVTVTAGALHHITVSPSNPSLAVNASQTFTAQGYDQYNNLRSGDVFTWSVTNPAAGSINASTGLFTAGTAAGTYSNVVRATSGVVVGTASVTVTAGALHHIIVSPLNPSVLVAGMQAYTAASYDQYNNPRSGDTFTWSVTNPAAGSINASTGVFTAGTVVGAYNNVIRAAAGVVNGTASVTVTAGVLHHITINPSNPSVQAGGSQAYTASGYDQYNNARSGDIFTWSVTNSVAGSINASTGMFTAGTVSGAYSNVVQAISGGVTGAASVTVTAGQLHHVVVAPYNPSVVAAGTQGFGAQGYDQFNNIRTSDTFTWSVSNQAAGSINASSGVFTGGTLAGTYNNTIQAASGSVTGTASVTLVAGPLHHITVTPTNPTLAAGGVQTFTAAGYDQYNNPRTGDSFNWSVTDPATGSINSSTGVFTAGGTLGVYTDLISVASGAITATASVTVTVGPLHHITVSPANPSVAVNGSQTFIAAGFDQFENPVSGLTFTWSVTSSSAGSIDASTGVFTAGTLARVFSNVVQVRSGAITGTTSVTVTPGPLHHIAVTPGNPYVPVNRSQIYSATGYDQYSNAISGLTFAWSLTDVNAGSIGATTGIFIAGNAPATYSDVIHVASGPITGTASVRVIDGNVLSGTVTLQGSGRTPSARVVPVTVKLFATGASNADLVNGSGALATFSADTEDVGSPTVFFQATGTDLIPGTYDVAISSPHTLMNVKRDVVLGTGATSVAFGTLLEGNANNDGIINALDFSIMAASYLKSSGQTGYDTRSDYDYSGTVNAIDFSLMAANYMKVSPIAAL